MSKLRVLLLLIAAIALLLPAPVTAGTAPADLVGQWTFIYRGRKRLFQFNENNTFVGHYPVSGHAFDGTWQFKGTQAVLFRNGKPGEFGKVTFGLSDEAEYFAEGFKMTGHRPKR